MQEAPSSVPAELSGPGQIGRRQTTYWELHPHGTSATFRVHFTEKQESRFESSDYDRIEFLEAHPVLTTYDERWMSLFVVQAQHDGPKLLEELAARVASATAGWRKSEEYLALGGFTELILSEGHGLLLRAPEGLARIAADVALAHGAIPSLLPDRPARPGYRALLLGRSFVVARAFRLDRLHP